MSVNKYRPHIFVLPEDDANSQIANGFVLDPNLNNRAIQILPPAGGWTKVRDAFTEIHAHELGKYTERRIVLLIDFDGQFAGRRSEIQNKIPNQLIDRVFVLGVLTNPEDLKVKVRKSFEKIGETLSQECVNETRVLWGHDFLRHNDPELDRMIIDVKPFLFN